MWSGGCVVWLFDYPHLQSLCLIINIVKAQTKAYLNCPNQKKVTQVAVCLCSKRSEIFDNNYSDTRIRIIVALYYLKRFEAYSKGLCMSKIP